VRASVGVARQVIAVDGIKERQRLAEGPGGVAVTPDGAASLVADASGGIGADIVVDAAGALPALDASFGRPAHTASCR
jgi:threonine dehydrogenase-like Zn-dependent dehydrogenase